jgi:RHS repeat-associated protein
MMTNYTYNDWLNGTGRLFSIQSQNQNTGETYQHQTYSYDYAGNLTNIIDYVNSWQIQSFTYDSLNRLLFATTDGVGQGQYQQDYRYDSYTGNLLSRSDVGTYTYAQSKPHAVSSAGTNTYVYDANGSMTHRNVGNTQWEYAYDAENRLVEVEKDGVVVNRYIYDGDGNRVARLGADNTGTVFISNYFEAVYPHNAIPEPPPPVTEGGGENEPNAPNPIPQGDITYYYAGSQRIALRDANGVYFLLSDHLGSSSIVMDASGQVVEEGYYMPWGGERGDQGIATTDYGFTGQMQEGDIYFYNSRWYDPQLGRFMQADTIVPMASQGTQAFDRYAYVNNNPLRFTDPSGNWLCDATEPGCWETSGESFDYGRQYSYISDEPLRYTIQGSYGFGVGPASAIDRYQDDLVSPSILSSHPAHVAVQLVDLTVRILEEFHPQPKYRKADDVFWSIYLEDYGDQLAIRNIFIYSFEESVLLRNIQVTEGTVGRRLFTFIPGGVANLKLGFETGDFGSFGVGQIPNNSQQYSIRINFGMRCYHCGGNYGVHLSGFDPYPLMPGSDIVFYQNWRNNAIDR